MAEKFQNLAERNVRADHEAQKNPDRLNLQRVINRHIKTKLQIQREL